MDFRQMHITAEPSQLLIPSVQSPPPPPHFSPCSATSPSLDSRDVGAVSVSPQANTAPTSPSLLKQTLSHNPLDASSWIKLIYAVVDSVIYSFIMIPFAVRSFLK